MLDDDLRPRASSNTRQRLRVAFVKPGPPRLPESRHETHPARARAVALQESQQSCAAGTQKGLR
jgi:hypothetical protein